MRLSLPPNGGSELAGIGERARTAVERLAEEGTAVRLVRSVYAPEDGICVLIFEARTLDTVRQVGRRAGLMHEHIGVATEGEM